MHGGDALAFVSRKKQKVVAKLKCQPLLMNGSRHDGAAIGSAEDAPAEDCVVGEGATGLPCLGLLPQQEEEASDPLNTPWMHEPDSGWDEQQGKVHGGLESIPNWTAPGRQTVRALSPGRKRQSEDVLGHEQSPGFLGSWATGPLGCGASDIGSGKERSRSRSCSQVRGLHLGKGLLMVCKTATFYMQRYILVELCITLLQKGYVVALHGKGLRHLYSRT
jgi:hypothetical protein